MSVGWMILATVLEIAGCYTLWMYLRLGRSGAWLIPGMLSLLLFAAALPRIDSGWAGRAYAAYGGVYIVSSLVWLALVEGHPPDGWDLLGGAVCLGGAGVILFAPR